LARLVAILSIPFQLNTHHSLFSKTILGLKPDCVSHLFCPIFGRMMFLNHTGSVEAEGYSWWNISVNDEIEGWAVNIPEWYEAVE